MIAKAISKILELQRPPTFQVDGRDYFANGSPALDPMEPSIITHTLTGLVDRIEEIKDSVSHQVHLIHVKDPFNVIVCGPIRGAFLQRPMLVKAELFDNDNPYRFGNFYDAESFNIRLQSQFVQDANTASVLALVGNIKEKNVKQTADDGITQTVVAKMGIARVEEVEVPNPVMLRPYRTFLEVAQPTLKCVLRLRSGPECALFEADGGMWRYVAIQSIRDWLKSALPNIPIIA